MPPGNSPGKPEYARQAAVEQVERSAQPRRARPPKWPGPFRGTSAQHQSFRVLNLGPHLNLLNQTQIVNGRRVGELNRNFHRSTRVDWASLTLVIQSQPS